MAHFNHLQNISIHQSKVELALITQKLNHLRNLEETLKESINITNEEWENKIKEINETKIIIENLLEKYSNKSLINLLKQKINKRKKKRTRLRRRNSKLKQQNIEILKNREKLHQQIDDWIESEKQKDLKIITQEKQAKQTEFMLSGVTKRKNEANRYIQLLNALKELRRIRKTAVAQHKIDLLEKSFQMKIDQLISVWKDALNEYEIEEKNLRSLLGNATKSSEDEWTECLFGVYSKNETIQLRAEENLKDFLEIRHTWDSYLVTEDSSYGSSIPIGWVMPNENPSDKWMPYCNSEDIAAKSDS